MIRTRGAGGALMLCANAERLPTGPGWMYEPKLDGWRGMLRRRGTSVTIASRSGGDLAGRFPELVAAALEAVPDGAALDGEIVCPSGEGVSFEGLMELREHGLQAAFVAFDLVELGAWTPRGCRSPTGAGGWSPVTGH